MIRNIRAIILAIALLAATLCYAQAESAEESLEEGNESMAAGKIDDAIAHYQTGLGMIEDISDNPAEALDLEIALGNAYMQKGTEEKKETGEDEDDENPNIERAKEHWENAIKVANGAKRRFRENLGYQKAEALYKYADAVKRDDLQKAVEYFTEAAHLRKGYWLAWVKLARIIEDVFDLKRESINGFKKSVEELKEAEVELKKLDPKEGDDTMKDYKEVIKAQEEEIKEMMKDSFIYNERFIKSLVQAYGILQTYDKKDIVDYPDDYEGTMAKIQLAIGRGAVKTANKNCAEAIGGASEKVFCKDVAIQAYENALEHDPKNEDAKKFLQIMYEDKSKKIFDKDYGKAMLKEFADRREEGYKAGRDEL